MSRFEKRLEKKGLQESTQQKYVDIIESAGQVNLLDWIEEKVKSSTPLGTVLPMRAAVKHYLISEMGYTADQCESLLPKAEGVEGSARQALTPEQLATFHGAVEREVPEPAKTILTLLPMTGLKISEICDLTVDCIHLRGENKKIELQEKSGKRVVPLTRRAASALTNYIEEYKPKTLCFEISPHGVRKYTRKLAMRYKDLASLSPEVLRVTFAILSIQKGVDLVALKQAMGHQNMATTRRYLDQVVES